MLPSAAGAVGRARPATLARRIVNDDIVRAAKHLLHRLDIHALSRHRRRILVLRVNLIELRGLALRLGHGLELVTIRRLDDGCSLTARLWDGLVRIGFGLVAGPALILLRGRHVAERGDDLARRVDRLQLHLQDEHAGLVGVEYLLHQRLDLGFDHLTAGGEDLLDLALADDLAHGAFRHRLHGLARIGDIEGVVFRLRRVDLPEDDEFYVGDVLVAGQHQALFRHVDLARGVRARIIRLRDEADIDRIPISDVQLVHGTDWKGPVVIETG